MSTHPQYCNTTVHAIRSQTIIIAVAMNIFIIINIMIIFPVLIQCIHTVEPLLMVTPTTWPELRSGLKSY